MQACVDWVLIIFGTQVIKKKRPVRPVLWLLYTVTYALVYINSTPTEISSPLRLWAISFKAILSAHRDSVSRIYKPHESTKAIWIWIMMFKSGGLLIFGMQEEIQTLRKSTEQI